MSNVLFLVAGDQQLEGIKYAKDKGYYIHTIDNNINNPGHIIANQAHYIDLYDVTCVVEIANKLKPKAVINFVSSHGLFAGIAAREELGLKGINREAFETVNCKKKFREFLYKSGFPTPRVYKIDEVESVITQKKLIVKPINGGGSKGIIKLEDEESTSSYLKNQVTGIDVIIEEFIEHDHRLNGDCLVVNDEIYFLVVGDYYYDEFNSLVSYSTAFPSNYDLKKVKQFLSSVIEKLGYGTGALNFEIVVRSGELFIIEINPRHSGNFIHEIISEIYNFRVAELYVDISLGDISNKKLLELENNIPSVSHEFYATAIMYSENTGTYLGINIDASLRPFIFKMVEFKKQGDMVSKFDSLYDRVALVILRFDSREAMDYVLRNFKLYYKINIQEF